MILPLLTNSCPTSRPWAHITAVVIGDDLGVGKASAFQTANLPHVPDLCYWTNLLTVQTGMKIINKAAVGRKSAELIDKFKTDVVSQKPTHCILCTGYSDAKQGASFDTLYQNIVQLLELCRQNQIKPLLLLPPPCCKTEGAEQILANLRPALCAYCDQQNVRYINLFGSPFLAGEGQNPDYFLENQIHLCQLGHMTIAQKILEEINDPGGSGIFRYMAVGISVDETTGIWTWIDPNGNAITNTPNSIPEPVEIDENIGRAVGISVDETTGVWTWIDPNGNSLQKNPNPTPPPVHIVDMTPAVFQIKHTFIYKKNYIFGLFHKKKKKTITCYYEAPKGLQELGKIKVLFSCDDDTTPMAIRYWEETLGLKAIIVHCDHD